MSAYDTPSGNCPYCEGIMEADWVDVGVGMVQCGPYHCYECNASEIGPELQDWYYKDRDGETIYLTGKRVYYKWGKKKIRLPGKPVLMPGHPFTERELMTGFYESKISPYANTVNGELVNHEEALESYKKGRLDSKKY